MASGDSVVEVLEIMPPGTVYATLDARVGGSTPAESVTVWDFDASTIEYLDFLCRLRGYDGGGLTFTITWMASSATSGVCRWGIAIRALPDDAEDVDAAHTYDFNDVDATPASASGEVAYDTITFTNGADMDSWADGELAIVRVRRNASHANDTMSGDAELLSISAIET
jgi:hypothetical protein